MATANTTKTKPAHEVRLGRIKATVWANEIYQGGTAYAVQIVRLYKEDDQWRDTTSFNRGDLPLVAKVADLAHTWIFQHAKEGNTA